MKNEEKFSCNETFLMFRPYNRQNIISMSGQTGTADGKMITDAKGQWPEWP